MTITRRRLITLISSFTLAILSPIQRGLGQEKNLSGKRKPISPFFLGWYDYIENSNVPKRISAGNINLLMPYIEKSKPAKVKIFLDAAQRANIKVVLEIYRNLIESENISAIQDFVRTYKRHPAVYAWYLYDEPEIKEPKPISPDLLKRVYAAIEQEDKSRPIAIVFADANKVEPYTDAMDILMWDRYPCEVGAPEFQWVPGYRHSLNRVSKLANERNKVFWNVIQAYQGHGLNKRLPTKAEFRYMFYAAVLAGADSLLFWMYPWSTATWNETVLYPAIKGFRAYLPAITAANNKNFASIDRAELEIKLYPIPKTNKVLAIAISHGANKINTFVQLDRRLAGKQVEIDRRKIGYLSKNSRLKVDLAAHEVKIYKIG